MGSSLCSLRCLLSTKGRRAGSTSCGQYSPYPKHTHRSLPGAPRKYPFMSHWPRMFDTPLPKPITGKGNEPASLPSPNHTHAPGMRHLEIPGQRGSGHFSHTRALLQQKRQHSGDQEDLFQSLSLVFGFGEIGK